MIFASVLMYVPMSGCNSGGGTAEGETIQTKRAGVNEVIVYESANPDKIQPLISTSAASGDPGEVLLSVPEVRGHAGLDGFSDLIQGASLPRKNDTDPKNDQAIRPGEFLGLLLPVHAYAS